MTTPPAPHWGTLGGLHPDHAPSSTPVVDFISRSNVKFGCCGDDHKHCVWVTDPSFGSSDTWFRLPSTFLRQSAPATGLLAFPLRHQAMRLASGVWRRVFPVWNTVRAAIHLASPSPPSSLCLNVFQQGFQHVTKIPPFLALCSALSFSLCLCPCVYAHPCAVWYACL